MKNSKLIGSDLTIVNQILPHTNKWAWDLYLKGCANNWMPTEISMQKDIEQWNSKILSDDEKLVVKRCLGFFAGSESLVSNNLLLNVFRYITDAECRQYISRQIFEETLHNLTVVYVCDSLSLNIDEVYNAYQSIPAIKAKDDFLMKATFDLNRPGFDINQLTDKIKFLRNLITYYILCEGMFFYAGFASLLSLGRRNILQGISEQINYTLRDEAIHIEFGINLITKIKQEIIQEYDNFYENFDCDFFDRQTLKQIKETCNLEIKFAEDMLPNGIMGVNKEQFVQYIHYLANRRANQLNLGNAFDKVENPFPWLSEVSDLPKMKNFFESRVIEYKSGGLDDDF